MNILLTGASGFVGQRLGIALVQAGHRVHALMRRPDPSRLPYPCEVFAWDGLQDPIPAPALAGVEAVMHLAGESIAGQRWRPEVKQRLRDSRILGTRHLIEALTRHEVQVLIGASAIGYYGERGDEVVDEDSGPGQDFLAELCRDWERELFAAKGPRTVAMRIGVVLDQGDGALAKMAPPFRDGYGAALGSGKQWLSWVHREDLVRMFLWALTNTSANGVYNAVAPQPETNRRLSECLAAHFRTWQLPKVPAPVLRIGLGEMASFLLASTRVTPRRLAQEGFTWQYPELGPALTATLPPLRPFEQYRVFAQYLPQPPEALFPFFEDAYNLEAITPPWLHFKVLGMDSEQIGPGTHIDYRLRLHGLPVRWQSLIESFDPPRQFVDRQTKGPYRSWHHTHTFAPLGSGTLMGDLLRYRLPASAVGHALASWKVERDVQAIFAYRRERLAERFAAIR